MWARATEDPLTHLASRLGFDAAAHALFDLTARSRLELDVLFLDLDGLKRINDEWGHAAGDEALVATATVLRASTRRSDLVARVGGDEFSVASWSARGPGPTRWYPASSRACRTGTGARGDRGSCR